MATLIFQARPASHFGTRASSLSRIGSWEKEGILHILGGCFQLHQEMRVENSPNHLRQGSSHSFWRGEDARWFERKGKTWSDHPNNTSGGKTQDECSDDVIFSLWESWSDSREEVEHHFSVVRPRRTSSSQDSLRPDFCLDASIYLCYQGRLLWAFTQEVQVQRLDYESKCPQEIGEPHCSRQCLRWDWYFDLTLSGPQFWFLYVRFSLIVCTMICCPRSIFLNSSSTSTIDKSSLSAVV